MNNFNDEPPIDEVLKLINSVPLEDWLPKPEQPVYSEFDFPSLAEFERQQIEKLIQQHKQPQKLRFNPDKGIFE